MRTRRIVIDLQILTPTRTLLLQWGGRGGDVTTGSTKLGYIRTVIARSPPQADDEAISQMSANHEIASLLSVARNDDK
jgi:hypothetical protein